MIYYLFFLAVCGFAIMVMLILNYLQIGLKKINTQTTLNITFAIIAFLFIMCPILKSMTLRLPGVEATLVMNEWRKKDNQFHKDFMKFASKRMDKLPDSKDKQKIEKGIEKIKEINRKLNEEDQSVIIYSSTSTEYYDSVTGIRNEIFGLMEERSK